MGPPLVDVWVRMSPLALYTKLYACKSEDIVKRGTKGRVLKHFNYNKYLVIDSIEE